MYRSKFGFTYWRALAATLLAFMAVAAAPATAKQEPAAVDGQLQQLPLNEDHIKGYLNIAPKLSKMFDRIDQAGGEPDAKLQAELEDIAKAGGFKSYEDLEIVVSNITFVMSGMNEEDGSFLEPVEVLQQELQDTEADTELKAKEREEMIAAIKESIAITPKLAHTDNIAIVKKYFKELSALFQE